MTSQNILPEKGVGSTGLPIEGQQFRYLVVVQNPTGDERKNVGPITSSSQMPGGITETTAPHGLDHIIAAAMDAIWYCLSLPRTGFDLRQVTPTTRIDLQVLPIPHAIDFIIAEEIDCYLQDAGQSDNLPHLILYRQENQAEVLRATGNSVNSIPYSAIEDLSNQSLAEHWAQLGGDKASTLATRLRELSQNTGDEPHVASLDFGFFNRKGDKVTETIPTTRGTALSALRDLRASSAREAYAKLSKDRPDPPFRLSAKQYEEAFSPPPVSIALPGTPRQYARNAFSPNCPSNSRITDGPSQLCWNESWSTLNDGQIEKAAIDLLLTHQTVAQEGIGFTEDTIPGELFGLVQQIEAYWRTARSPKPQGIWKNLSKISASMGRILSPEAVEALRTAPHAQFFSNFPVGLATLPGDEEFLTFRLPISINSLTPLTWVLQRSMHARSQVFASERLKALIIECIPDSDGVGKISRKLWHDVVSLARSRGSAGALIEYEAVTTVAGINESLRRHSPDILVISAHGRQTGNGSGAGIDVGGNLVLGDELGPMPPLVILSACHVAPRGQGAVNITEMLLLQGARAVLSTQVPVDVGRSARVTAHFLEALHRMHIQGGGSVLAVWSEVQRIQSFYDVAFGNAKISPWVRSLTSGAEKLNSIVKRETGTNISGISGYSGAKKALLAVATRRGLGKEVTKWLESPGYLPEIAFYQFIGHPQWLFVGKMGN